MLVMSVCSEYISSYEAKHCYELSNVRMVSFKVTTIEIDDNRNDEHFNYMKMVSCKVMTLAISFPIQ